MEDKIKAAVMKTLVAEVESFAQSNPAAKKLASERYYGKEDSDSGEAKVINYLNQEGQPTQFYGAFDRAWCSCGCGEGHSDIAVFRIEDMDDLEKFIGLAKACKENRRFLSYGYTDRMCNQGREISHNPKQGEKLFDILTFKWGSKRFGESEVDATISGIKVDPNTAYRLMSQLG